MENVSRREISPAGTELIACLWANSVAANRPVEIVDPCPCSSSWVDVERRATTLSDIERQLAIGDVQQVRLRIDRRLPHVRRPRDAASRALLHDVCQACATAGDRRRLTSTSVEVQQFAPWS
jgi:hypothetical protein